MKITFNDKENPTFYTFTDIKDNPGLYYNKHSGIYILNTGYKHDTGEYSLINFRNDIMCKNKGNYNDWLGCLFVKIESAKITIEV